MLEVANGIQYIHAEGIIHGNIHGASIGISDVEPILMFMH